MRTTLRVKARMKKVETDAGYVVVPTGGRGPCRGGSYIK